MARSSAPDTGLLARAKWLSEDQLGAMSGFTELGVQIVSLPVLEN